jgi:hypothetical protein
MQATICLKCSIKWFTHVPVCFRIIHVMSHCSSDVMLNVYIRHEKYLSTSRITWSGVLLFIHLNKPNTKHTTLVVTIRYEKIICFCFMIEWRPVPLSIQFAILILHIHVWKTAPSRLEGRMFNLHTVWIWCHGPAWEIQWRDCVTLAVRPCRQISIICFIVNSLKVF